MLTIFFANPVPMTRDSLFDYMKTFLITAKTETGEWWEASHLNVTPPQWEQIKGWSKNEYGSYESPPEDMCMLAGMYFNKEATAFNMICDKYPGNLVLTV